MTTTSTSRRRELPQGTPGSSTQKGRLTARQQIAMPRTPKSEDWGTGPPIKLHGNQESRVDESTSSSFMKLVSHIVANTVPQFLVIGVTLGLIFGGCCSNVYALEAIIQVEPLSGTLLTFVQFLFVAVTGYISQFDRSRPPFFLQRNKVPLRRWVVNIVLFFSINVMNNHAFSYDISVPVHIILRSGGSITTMLAGWLYGKRYSKTQVTAVVLLTVGVITAAWSDSKDKAGINVDRAAEQDVLDSTSSRSSKPSFSTGLVILFVAQVLSAIMGLYTEETYRTYGPQWKENLFYSHLLSLPLFLPFMPSMAKQLARLAGSQPLSLPSWAYIAAFASRSVSQASRDGLYIPSQLAYLLINVLTQYACIRGVNRLAAASSALTVTIVLNIRKLVSLLLSIWLFGNQLATGTLVGAIIVFGAGGLYSLDSRAKGKN
ncbi:UDP-N-acetylglucosamine transporter YEA4 [Sodiomyces alkalinus F11]|uniref:UDP-N-acetylglucosamine transporter YEA4 n=1 Tax=Sodiomyces alkalinus (strain CBS 110278 / VKM F-3762 / F11) TaxID=1314773 RepID=A0A3N2PRC2_SODAK|nr:UDP-N-acetylglucosamine transporter YEA4 [Sodiomyces alkalinus F11]ROT37047.1 UDP-N-acetylglucosamine transporter YEA4 [Sodiomyces alkalinus F11]